VWTSAYDVNDPNLNENVAKDFIKRYKKIMEFEGICDHDTGFLCNHREKALTELLTDLLFEVGRTP
jgi:hypothetical protein